MFNRQYLFLTKTSCQQSLNKLHEITILIVFIILVHLYELRIYTYTLRIGRKRKDLTISVPIVVGMYLLLYSWYTDI